MYFCNQQERSHRRPPPVASGKQGSGAAVTGTKQKSREWTRVDANHIGCLQGFSHYRFTFWSCEHTPVFSGPFCRFFVFCGSRILVAFVPRKVLVGQVPRTFGLSAGPVHCAPYSVLVQLLRTFFCLASLIRNFRLTTDAIEIGPPAAV